MRPLRVGLASSHDPTCYPLEASSTTLLQYPPEIRRRAGPTFPVLAWEVSWEFESCSDTVREAGFSVLLKYGEVVTWGEHPSSSALLTVPRETKQTLKHVSNFTLVPSLFLLIVSPSIDAPVVQLLQLWSSFTTTGPLVPVGLVFRFMQQS